MNDWHLPDRGADVTSLGLLCGYNAQQAGTYRYFDSPADWRYRRYACSHSHSHADSRRRSNAHRGPAAGCDSPTRRKYVPAATITHVDATRPIGNTDADPRTSRYLHPYTLPHSCSIANARSHPHTRTHTEF